MACTAHKVTVLENSRVSPPPATVVAVSIELKFFDIPTLSSVPPALFFYKYCNCDFEILVPILKNSLSITLKHFSFLAGNLILYDPSVTNNRHEIRYVDGDSVQLTFATCDGNFDDLVEKNPISVTELVHFSPVLAHAVEFEDSIVAPVFAIQVTFFQNQGICIGITREHVVGDANTWVRFMRAWGLITKTSSDESFSKSDLIPSFDRSVIEDPKDLYNLYLSQSSNLPDKFKARCQNVVPPKHDIMRGTFVITQTEIHHLKKLVIENTTSLHRISSFVVVSAYILSCVAKVHNEKAVYRFKCTVNLRGRFSTIPENYFGNCILPCSTTVDSAALTGENGVILAAEKIGGAISNFLNNENGILDCAENWIVDRPRKEETLFWIGGSPRYSLHDIDFGWGMPAMTQYAYGFESVVTLHGHGDPRGGLEIALGLPKDKMDAFIIIFENGLNRGK